MRSISRHTTPHDAPRAVEGGAPFVTRASGAPRTIIARPHTDLDAPQLAPEAEDVIGQLGLRGRETAHHSFHRRSGVKT